MSAVLSFIACFVFSLMMRPLPRATLFPYTTLFRSRRNERAHVAARVGEEISRDLVRQLESPRARVGGEGRALLDIGERQEDRKSTRLNSSHRCISYAVFCLKKKKKPRMPT